MPLDATWIEEDIAGLHGDERAIARLAVVLAKAPYRVTDTMVRDVLSRCEDTEHFVRVLAWSSYATARRFGELVAHRTGLESTSKPLTAVA